MQDFFKKTKKMSAYLFVSNSQMLEIVNSFWDGLAKQPNLYSSSFLASNSYIKINLKESKNARIKWT